jgi:hypothetical protein
MRHSLAFRIVGCLVIVAMPCSVLAAETPLKPQAPSPAPATGSAVAMVDTIADPPPAPGPAAPADSPQPQIGSLTGPAPTLSIAPSMKRPPALPALYVSFATLQMLDAASTFRALGQGATEANPALGGIASNKGAMLGVKVGVTAGTIFLTEKLWKKNRVAAIGLMAVLNGAYAAIVAHNYRVSASLK